MIMHNMSTKKESCLFILHWNVPTETFRPKTTLWDEPHEVILLFELNIKSYQLYYFRAPNGMSSQLTDDLNHWMFFMFTSFHPAVLNLLNEHYRYYHS